MPRRYADYAAQFTDWNRVATVGAFVFGLAQVYFLFAVALPAYLGAKYLERVGASPWDGAQGLEWTVPSPAPYHTFETPPVVE
jgi:cytochrome c oxidase subunit 1